jgi:hypothetical protein
MKTSTRTFCGRVVAAVLLAGCCLAQRPGAPAPGSAEAELARYIREEQRQYVRLSRGIWAHECFTEDNYRAFRAAHTVASIAQAAKRSPRFRAIAALIAQLPRDRQHVLLEQAARIAHPTWAELGRITANGTGQTEAGAAAEHEISAALVGVAREIIAEDRPRPRN